MQCCFLMNILKQHQRRRKTNIMEFLLSVLTLRSNSKEEKMKVVPLGNNDTMIAHNYTTRCQEAWNFRSNVTFSCIQPKGQSAEIRMESMRHLASMRCNQTALLFSKLRWKTFEFVLALFLVHSRVWHSRIMNAWESAFWPSFSIIAMLALAWYVQMCIRIIRCRVSLTQFWFRLSTLIAKEAYLLTSILYLLIPFNLSFHWAQL